MNIYLDLVKTVLDKGIRRTNRTGIDTFMYFGYHYKIDLSKGFPLLTTKKIFFNSVIRELLWYLKGETHIRDLRNYTKIWDAWTNEEKNWEIGKMYGYQWVKWEKFSTNSKTGKIKKTYRAIVWGDIIDKGEIEGYIKRDNNATEIFYQMAEYAPAFGMIGTLVGLIIMLDNLGGDPAGIGQGLAMALVTTLYGVLLARLLFMPAANKSQQNHSIIRYRNYVMLEGFVMLAEDKSPRFIQDKLNAALDAAVRYDIDTQGKG